MKKIIVMIMTLTMAMLLAACGKKTEGQSEIGTQSDQQGVYTLNNVTTNNYAQVMKAIYGIEPVVESGWKAEKVETNDYNLLEIQFIADKEIDKEAVMESYFNAANSISEKGVEAVNASKSVSAASYEEYKNNDPTFLKYYYDGKEISISTFFYKDGKKMDFSIHH